VIRYRQYKADGTIIEAYWLTNFSTHQVGSESLYRMAKARWEVKIKASTTQRTATPNISPIFVIV